MHIKLLKEPEGYYFEAKLQLALAARAEQISIYDGTYSILNCNISNHYL